MKVCLFARDSGERGKAGVVVAERVFRRHSRAKGRWQLPSRYALEATFCWRRRRLNLTISRQAAEKATNGERSTALCHALTTTTTIGRRSRIRKWIFRIVSCSAQLLRPLLPLLVPPKYNQRNNQQHGKTAESTDNTANDLWCSCPVGVVPSAVCAAG